MGGFVSSSPVLRGWGVASLGDRGFLGPRMCFGLLSSSCWVRPTTSQTEINRRRKKKGNVVTGKKGHQRQTEKCACTNVEQKYIGTLMLWVLSNVFFCSVVHVFIRLARRATTQIAGEQKKSGITASEEGQQRQTEKRACTNVAHRYIPWAATQTAGRQKKKT